MGIKESVETLVAASHTDRSIEGPVYVQVTLAEPAVSERMQHPILLPLPHRFRRKDETMVSLVTKDPGTAVAQELGESKHTNALFDEIVGVGKLRRRVANGKKTGKTTKAGEQFAKTFALIFVQDKVREPLAEVLGLGFYKRARQLPIPISSATGTDEDRKQLRFVVKAAMQSAQLILRPESKSVSVRVGHTKMDAAKLVANVEAAVKLCTERIPRGLGGSSTYYVKTPDSLALKL